MRVNIIIMLHNMMIISNVMEEFQISLCLQFQHYSFTNNDDWSF